MYVKRVKRQSHRIDIDTISASADRLSNTLCPDFSEDRSLGKLGEATTNVTQTCHSLFVPRDRLYQQPRWTFDEPPTSYPVRVRDLLFSSP
jgi:hypothetical protein